MIIGLTINMNLPTFHQFFDGTKYSHSLNGMIIYNAVLYKGVKSVREFEKNVVKN